MIAAALAYVLALAFFGLEYFLRRGSRAQPLARSVRDRGNSQLIGASYVLGVLLAPILNIISVGRLPQEAVIRAVGLGIMVLGLAIRVWSMRTLGVFYTRALTVADGQAIVQSGPYHWIRHPGYLGSLLVWIGLPIALANWTAACAVLLLMGSAYARRIRTEEAMLVGEFGSEYLQYMKRTRRLIPFLL